METKRRLTEEKRGVNWKPVILNNHLHIRFNSKSSAWPSIIRARIDSDDGSGGSSEARMRLRDGVRQGVRWVPAVCLWHEICPVADKARWVAQAVP